LRRRRWKSQLQREFRRLPRHKRRTIMRNITKMQRKQHGTITKR
jgi:hypothetical protein